MKVDVSGKNGGLFRKYSLLIVWENSQKSRTVFEEKAAWPRLQALMNCMANFCGEISMKTECGFNKTYTICCMTLDPGSGW